MARGILRRCGEQEAQTTRPQRRQWWRLLKKVKAILQMGQAFAVASGCQTGGEETGDEEEEAETMRRRWYSMVFGVLVVLVSERRR